MTYQTEFVQRYGQETDLVQGKSINGLNQIIEGDGTAVSIDGDDSGKKFDEYPDFHDDHILDDAENDYRDPQATSRGQYGDLEDNITSFRLDDLFTPDDDPDYRNFWLRRLEGTGVHEDDHHEYKTSVSCDQYEDWEEYRTSSRFDDLFTPDDDSRDISIEPDCPGTDGIGGESKMISHDRNEDWEDIIESSRFDDLFIPNDTDRDRDISIERDDGSSGDHHKSKTTSRDPNEELEENKTASRVDSLFTPNDDSRDISIEPDCSGTDGIRRESKMISHDQNENWEYNIQSSRFDDIFTPNDTERDDGSSGDHHKSKTTSRDPNEDWEDTITSTRLDDLFTRNDDDEPNATAVNEDEDWEDNIFVARIDTHSVGSYLNDDEMEEPETETAKDDIFVMEEPETETAKDDTSFGARYASGPLFEDVRIQESQVVNLSTTANGIPDFEHYDNTGTEVGPLSEAWGEIIETTETITRHCAVDPHGASRAERREQKKRYRMALKLFQRHAEELDILERVLFNAEHDEDYEQVGFLGYNDDFPAQEIEYRESLPRLDAVNSALHQFAESFDNWCTFWCWRK